jgi:hypothetical protein
VPGTKASYIASGDQLCGLSRSTRDRLEVKARAAATPKEKARSLRELADWAAKLLTKFRAIRVPPADKKTIGQYLSSIQAEGMVVRRAAQAYATGHPARAKSLMGDAARLGSQGQRIAQRYGFEVCGSG